MSNTHKPYRKREAVVLSQEQRDQLQRLVRSGRCSARTLTRARILLLGDHSEQKQRTDTQIAQVLGITRPTVRSIRRRFLEEGLSSALTEKPRPGAKPKITGDVEAKLIALACSPAPEGRERWTLQLLADKLVELNLVESISDVAVMNRLKQTH